MRRMTASQFRAQCLSLLDNVATEGIVITRHGRPVARLVPYPQAPADLIGSLAHKLRIEQDIVTAGMARSAGSPSCCRHPAQDLS